MGLCSAITSRPLPPPAHPAALPPTPTPALPSKHGPPDPYTADAQGKVKHCTRDDVGRPSQVCVQLGRLQEKQLS